MRINKISLLFITIYFFFSVNFLAYAHEDDAAIHQFAGIFNFFSSPSPSPRQTNIPLPTNKPDTQKEISNDSIELELDKIMVANSRLEDLPNSVLAVPIAKERQILMKDLAKRDPRSFLKVTLPASTRSKLVTEAQKYVEKKEILTGALTVVHSDDFENQDNSRFFYDLTVKNQKYSLNFPLEISGKVSGTARVSGFSIDDQIVLDGGDRSLILLAGQEAKAALGEQKTLVFIVEPKNKVSLVTSEEVDKALFDPNSPFETYFKNQSYGKVWFTGKTYEISIDRDVDKGVCYTGGRGASLDNPDVREKIESLNIDFDGVDRLIFISDIIGGCSGVGKHLYTINGKPYNLSSFIGGWDDFKYSLDTNTISKTMAHEMGHSLGVHHANALLCYANNNCKHEEYGNIYDMMGYGVGEFNALYKEQLNWLLPSDFLNITKTGDFNIKNLGSQNGIRAAKVVNPIIGPESIMYLETRKDIYGILLNIPEYPEYLKTTAPELIDMAPLSDEFYLGPSLGKSFTPDSSGVTFGKVQEKNEGDDSVNFHVDIGKVSCVGQNPSLSNRDDSKEIPALPGSHAGLFVWMTNVDKKCFPSSEFKIEFTDLPTGWTIDKDTYHDKLELSSGKSDYFSLSVIIPEDAIPNLYNLRYKVTNQSTKKVAFGSFTLKIKGSRITGISTTKVKAGDSMQIYTEDLGDVYSVVTLENKENLQSFNIFNDKVNKNGVIDVYVLDTIPPGEYEVNIFALNRKLNTVFLTVEKGLDFVPPEVLMTENPKLSLSYDFLHNESYLASEFIFDIKTGNKKVKIFNRAGIYFQNINTSSIPGGSSSINGEIKVVSGKEVKIEADEFGSTFITIPATTTARFKINAEANPQIMSPGTYVAKLTNIISIYGKNQYTDLTLPDNQSNQVTIIGETSPYITSVTSPVSLCDFLTIKGARFSLKNNTIIVTGGIDKEYKKIPSSSDRSTISFTPFSLGLIPGSYVLTVTNADMGKSAGLSNGYGFKVSDKDKTCPSITPSPSPQSLPKKPAESTKGFMGALQSFGNAILDVDNYLINKLATKAPSLPIRDTNTPSPVPIVPKLSPSPSPAPSIVVTSSPSPTPTPTPTTLTTPKPSTSPSPSPKPSSSVTPTPILSVTPTPKSSPTPSISPKQSPSPTPSNTPLNTPSNSPSPAPSIVVTSSPTPTPTPTTSTTPKPSPSPTPVSSASPSPVTTVEPKVSSTQSAVSSGSSLNLNVTLPTGATEANIYMSCPTGVTSSPSNVCNNYYSVLGKTTMPVTLYNSTTQSQSVYTIMYTRISSGEVRTSDMSVKLLAPVSSPSPSSSPSASAVSTYANAWLALKIIFGF